MCLIIDVAVPGDQNIIMKERERVEKYGDLKIEIAKMWQLRKSSINVIGILCSIPSNLKKHLDTLEIPYNLCVLLKSALLATARLLLNVLSV